MSATPARRCAYVVLRRVFEQDAWADRALHAEARRHRLDGRERALATQLAYGAVQRAKTLDFVVERLAGRPVSELDAPLRAGLRLGLFQLCFLDRVPAHAAVGEAVELVKGDAPRGAGLVNAVLRRAAREAGRLLAALGDTTPAEAAVCHSHPEWIADLWWEALGAEAARALMAADNAPAEAVLRANTLRVEAAELAARLPVAAHADAALPEALVLDGPLDAFGTPEWGDGLLMPQSRAAMTVSHLLAPEPGERVLDLCAAPGGKTTHLAALMGGSGAVVAVERHPGRAAALAKTARRMGAASVEVLCADAGAIDFEAEFDRVLVDPPCSDLGTLASRPDARWRKSAEQVQRLSGTQAAILAAGARALRPGGVLVYSTCTISPAENEGVVEGFLAGRPDFAVDDLSNDLPVWQHPSVPVYAQTLPHRDGTEGFFFARLRREAGS